MRPLLALALLTPVAALFPVATTVPGEPVRHWLEAGALVAAAGWIALLVDADPELVLGPIRPVPVGAAATAGACLAVAAVRRPLGRRSVYAGGVALGGVGLGLGADTFALLAVGLSAAVLAIAAAAWREEESALPAAALGAAGVAAVVAAVTRLHSDHDWTIPQQALTADGAVVALVAGGAALLVIAGGIRPRRTVSVLLPAGLAVGVLLLPLVGDGVDGEPVLALLLALGAALTSGPGLPSRSLRQLPVAVPVGLLALSAAAGPEPHLAPAALLAAGSVVAAVLATPAAVVAALPGAVAFAAALTETGGADAVVIAVLVLVTAASVAADARAPARRRGRSTPPLAAAIGLGIGGWLVVAPDSWAWAGEAGLAPYQEGASAAAAAALIVMVAVAASGRRAPVVPVAALLADDAPLRAAAPWGRRAAVAASAVLGISLAGLLASATLGG